MLDARLSDVNVGDAGVEGLRLSNDGAVWSSGCVSPFGNFLFSCTWCLAYSRIDRGSIKTLGSPSDAYFFKTLGV